jgi:H+/Cl- antiporter ClcA
MEFELKSSVAACSRTPAGTLAPTLFLGLFLALFLCLAGCGQKGPLTLPKAAAAASAPSP